jgi:hypothetical protein
MTYSGKVYGDLHTGCYRKSQDLTLVHISIGHLAKVYVLKSDLYIILLSYKNLPDCAVNTIGNGFHIYKLLPGANPTTFAFTTTTPAL